MHLDLRSKFAVFLCTVFLASVLSNDTVFFLLTAILIIYSTILGYLKIAARIAIVIILISLMRTISEGNGFGVMLPDMFLFIVLRSLVIFLSVIPIVKTSPGELMAFMKKFKVHRNIALPLIFMLRFFPVVKSEFLEIIDSLKLRGLISFKKPFTTMEYLFVPMMFSSSNVSEELAAASEVRGISAKGIHTSRRVIKFRINDYIILILTIFVTLGLYLLEGAI
ncbi:energy-coupling factor transporter transmembrane protein EcfT [Peptoniphilus sp. MSJ-1]|uniref:Energy-coupling factor transporter transmembrane protein EcfT n=1 Tax=Peptoniphilus ovalis TaxID=2841503 RepID=A0ABS6FIH7_9FIRM|nr:energy-coupling factor transporter transmembrane component T [Peptoniphilus ovalis]MBU5669969.1 energy-coupling factor transporter transmembrane protein EcfT [Peptoniphilus ovalis]